MGQFIRKLVASNAEGMQIIDGALVFTQGNTALTIREVDGVYGYALHHTPPQQPTPSPPKDTSDPLVAPPNCKTIIIERSPEETVLNYDNLVRFLKDMKSLLEKIRADETRETLLKKISHLGTKERSEGASKEQSPLQTIFETARKEYEALRKAHPEKPLPPITSKFDDEMATLINNICASIVIVKEHMTRLLEEGFTENSPLATHNVIETVDVVKDGHLIPIERCRNIINLSEVSHNRAGTGTQTIFTNCIRLLEKTFQLKGRLQVENSRLPSTSELLEENKATILWLSEQIKNIYDILDLLNESLTIFTKSLLEKNDPWSYSYISRTATDSTPARISTRVISTCNQNIPDKKEASITPHIPFVALLSLTEDPNLYANLENLRKEIISAFRYVELYKESIFKAERTEEETMSLKQGIAGKMSRQESLDKLRGKLHHLQTTVLPNIKKLIENVSRETTASTTTVETREKEESPYATSCLKVNTAKHTKKVLGHFEAITYKLILHLETLITKQEKIIKDLNQPPPVPKKPHDYAKPFGHLPNAPYISSGTSSTYTTPQDKRDSRITEGFAISCHNAGLLLPDASYTPSTDQLLEVANQIGYVNLQNALTTAKQSAPHEKDKATGITIDPTLTDGDLELATKWQVPIRLRGKPRPKDEILREIEGNIRLAETQTNARRQSILSKLMPKRKDSSKI